MTPGLVHSLIVLLTLVAPFLLLETWRSGRNEARLRARGAIEPADDVYRWMQAVYPGMFALMAIEGGVRDPPPFAILAAGVVVFLASKALKWWAILSLGELWSFRVLVLPGAPLVTSGPYRFLRHPNYVALVLEALGAALMWGAWWAGLIGALVFGVLVWRRIGIEERALGMR
jgi:methyltransferase